MFIQNNNRRPAIMSGIFVMFVLKLLIEKSQLLDFEYFFCKPSGYKRLTTEYHRVNFVEIHSIECYRITGPYRQTLSRRQD